MISLIRILWISFIALFFSVQSLEAAAPLAGKEMKQLEALYNRGMQLMQEEQYEDAVEVFKKVLEVNPKMAAIHNLMGLAYMRQEMTASAINSFLDAVKIDPNYAQAYFNLATIYAGPGDDRLTAAEYYEKTVQADPNHVQANYGLAWIQLIEFDEVQGAIKSFEKVVSLSPNIPEAHYGLAMAYLKNNQRARTLQPLSMLRSLNRDDLAVKIENIIRGNEGIVPEEGDGLAGYASTFSAVESAPIPAKPIETNINATDYMEETSGKEGSHGY